MDTKQEKHTLAFLAGIIGPLRPTAFGQFIETLKEDNIHHTVNVFVNSVCQQSNFDESTISLHQRIRFVAVQKTYRFTTIQGHYKTTEEKFPDDAKVFQERVLFNITGYNSQLMAMMGYLCGLKKIFPMTPHTTIQSLLELCNLAVNAVIHCEAVPTAPYQYLMRNRTQPPALASKDESESESESDGDGFEEVSP